jgi:riboflavin kinase/FMN adenylyltransferase
MLIVHGRDAAFPSGPAAYVTLGVFDGVHRGHRSVLGRLTQWARDSGGRSVVITFDAHPEGVLRAASPGFLTSLQHRLRLFAELGVEASVVLSFDGRLAATEPEDFLRRIVRDWTGARGLLLGHDQRFGRAGRGDAALAQRLAPDIGLEVRVVPAVLVDGRVVSSTAIRAAILRGDLDAAANMLGRPVSVLGTVIRGQGKGRELGFPTANLDLHHETRPPEGVYAAVVRLDERDLPAVVNIGRRPDLARGGRTYLDAEPIIEAHLLDFDGDLYGRDIEVRFVAKLRDELAFSGAADLRRQIQLDADQARALFRRTEV